jgi:hypothetical protein
MKIPDEVAVGNRWTRRLFLVLMVICILLLVWHTLYWYREINDDAYISFRYARNLAQGEGLTYNPGERVEGFSNFLWVVLLALSLRLGVADLAVAAKVMGLLFSCGTIVLAALLFRRLYREFHPLWSIGPPFLLALNPFFASWTTRGLEGAFFTFLLVGGIYLYSLGIHRTARGTVLLALVFFMVSITRPEGILFLLVPMAEALISLFRGEGFKGEDLRLVLLTGFLFGLFLAWRMVYFGEIYPNTYFAKTTYGLPFFLKPRAARYITSYFFHQSLAFSALVVGSLLTAALTRRLPRLAATPILVGIFYIWYVNGDWMDNYRFFVPLLPFIYILAAGSLPLSMDLAGKNRLTGYALLALLLISAGGYLGHGLRVESDGRYSRQGDLHLKWRKTWWTAPWKLPSLGFESLLWPQTRWIMENAGEETLTALPDIGFFGYVTDLPIYDTQGLVNGSLSRLFHMKRQKRDYVDTELLRDFIEAAPDYVFLRRRRQSGEGLNPLERVVLSSPVLSAGWVRGDPYGFSQELEMEFYVKKPPPGGASDELRLERYREAIRWNPRVPTLYAGLRDLYYELGETAMAEEISREAKERFPFARSFQ